MFWIAVSMLIMLGIVFFSFRNRIEYYLMDLGFFC